MDLFSAITLLCRVHLRETDDDKGYAIFPGAVPHPGYDANHYGEAWAEMRHHVKYGRSTQPPVRGQTADDERRRAGLAGNGDSTGSNPVRGAT
jgi:hypothetical protein